MTPSRPAAPTGAGHTPDRVAPAAGWFRSASRRSVLRGAFVAGAAGAATVAAAAPAVAMTRAAPPDLRPGRPLLLRGGIVVTMDPAAGVLLGADVLVRAGRIEAVGPNLTRPADATVLDVTGRIVLPGMIDTHRHMWQTSLRGLGAEWTIPQYVEYMFGLLGPLHGPDDAYASSLLGGIEAIDTGVTTVVDWAHNMRTPDHGNATLDALLDSGVRARLAYGRYDTPPQDWVPRGEVDRLLSERFPTAGDRVTLQIAMDVGSDPSFPERPAWEHARDRGIAVTTHAGVWNVNDDVTPKLLRDAGLLLPSTTYVHASRFSQESYEIIAASGGSVSVASESDLQGGQGYPPTAQLRAAGVNASLSVDTVAWFSGDMFSAMRSTLSADRGLAHLRAHENGQTVTNNALRTEDVLTYATMGGARALGLADQLGSVTPGKLADLVVLDTGTAGMVPLTNPLGAVVSQASRREVDTVIVGGQVVKHAGRLVDDRLNRARDLAEASRDRLLAAIGPAKAAELMAPPRG